MVDLVGVGMPAVARRRRNTGNGPVLGRRMRFPALVLASVAALVALTVLASPADATHTRMIDAGEVQMSHDVFGQHYFGHNEAPPSLGTGTTAAVLRYSPAGSMGAAYEGVARHIDHTFQDAWLGWGVSLDEGPGPQYGGCQQRPTFPPGGGGGWPCMGAGTTSTTGDPGFAPAAPTPASVSECARFILYIGSGGYGTFASPPNPAGTTGKPLHVRHDLCPEADNIYREDITLKNRYADAPLTDVRYRRAVEWNTETLSANMGAPQYVTIGGTYPPPALLSGFGDDGRASIDAYTPFAAPVCAAPGVYFENCTAGKGFVFDLSFGTLDPLEEVSFCMFYGGAPSFAEALQEIRELDMRMYSIAYRADDEPATFFAGLGCLPSEPIVDFAWTSEPHVYAPSGWTPLTPCAGSKVTFSDLSFLNGLTRRDPSRSSWAFGDGDWANTSWSDEVQHIYGAPGVYNVSLTVWGPDNVNATLTKPITVLDCRPPPPVNEAPVLMTLPCKMVTEGSLVTFRLTAFDPDGPPDPAGYYRLTFSLSGAPPGAAVTDAGFRWQADRLGEFRFTIRVQDDGFPPLSDETEACITVYPRQPAPESSDADGDGVPDAHDPCPATASAAGCPEQRDPAEEETGEHMGQEGSGGGCDVVDLVPRDVEARLEEGRAVITWRAPPDCLLDRFLVWNGTQGDLIASVPYDPDVDVYEAIDLDPWDQPHRYYVQAEGGPGVDVFVYPRSVPTAIVVGESCLDCDGRPPEPVSDDVPPIGGQGALLNAGRNLAGSWFPWILVFLAAWWLWHSYGMLVRLFSRLDERTALEHPTRSLLHGIVVSDPGVHAREIVRRAGKPRGVVRHHLKILVATGLLKEESMDAHTRYFPAGAREAAAKAALLQSDVARAVLEHVQDRPGISITELARQLGVTNKAVRYHVRRFAEAGMVDMQRTKAGFTVRPHRSPEGAPGIAS